MSNNNNHGAAFDNFSASGQGKVRQMNATTYGSSGFRQQQPMFDISGGGQVA